MNISLLPFLLQLFIVFLIFPPQTEFLTNTARAPCIAGVQTCGWLPPSSSFLVVFEGAWQVLQNWVVLLLNKVVVNVFVFWE
jgi:hypothetical protein